MCKPTANVAPADPKFMGKQTVRGKITISNMEQGGGGHEGCRRQHGTETGRSSKSTLRADKERRKRRKGKGRACELDEGKGRGKEKGKRENNAGYFDTTVTLRHLPGSRFGPVFPECQAGMTSNINRTNVCSSNNSVANPGHEGLPPNKANPHRATKRVAAQGEREPHVTHIPSRPKRTLAQRMQPRAKQAPCDLWTSPTKRWLRSSARSSPRRPLPCHASCSQTALTLSHTLIQIETISHHTSTCNDSSEASALGMCLCAFKCLYFGYAGMGWQSSSVRIRIRVQLGPPCLRKTHIATPASRTLR